MKKFIIFGTLCVTLATCIHVPIGHDYVEVESYGQNLQYREHKKAKKEQDLHKIPGTPGVDYPVYHTVPHTSFHCGNVPATPGMYANVETGCQAYHVCYDGREGEQGASFLCTNGTIFNQKEFTCDWWYNVDCHAALDYYRLNLDPEHNPYFPKKKEEEADKFLIHA
ncbi:uncharacterized protein LOC119082714 [Bradysia coprophila]|uniref:uncharacterized protein LOC119082714 n=1 Tax=Bradysia coprophila TaxID=38358 RepID=UPI00187D70A5|nr:uncharacterized protein LOC119082714 [Bradysia coprophila]